MTSPATGRPAAVLTLLAAALAAGLLCLAGAYPMAAVARAVSADGSLAPSYEALLVGSQRLLAVALLAGACAAWSAPGWLPRVRRAIDACPGRAFAALLFAAGAVPAWWFQQRWFEGLPHVSDAISHVFQAHIFAAGHAVAPAPGCPMAFFADNVLIRPHGVWHTKYFPGMALWLAAWLRVGLLAWALPAAWGGTLVCVARAASICYSRTVGRAAGLLLATSPMGVLLAGSYMSHSLAVFWLAVAAWALAEGLAADRLRWHVLAGIAAGAALITRPQDLPAAGVLALCALAAATAETRRRIGRALLPGALGAALPLLVLAAWNRAVFGAWLASGYNFGTTLSVTPVIRDAIGFTAWFTPRDAVRNLFWTVLRLNKALLGWPSSLLLVPAAFLVRRPDRRDLALLLAVAAVMGVYFFFPYYGFEYEARYHLAAAPLLVVLVVRGLGRLARPGPGAAALAAGFVAASLLHGALYYWPRYLAPQYRPAYEHVSAEVDRRAAEAHLGRALVLMPSGVDAAFAYGAGFVHNDPWLRREVIYARDLPEELPCLRARFPDRALFRFREASRTFEPVN